MSMSRAPLAWRIRRLGLGTCGRPKLACDQDCPEMENTDGYERRRKRLCLQERTCPDSRGVPGRRPWNASR